MQKEERQITAPVKAQYLHQATCGQLLGDPEVVLAKRDFLGYAGETGSGEAQMSSSRAS